MTQADRNLMVIQNFILHVTHSSEDEKDENVHKLINLTPHDLYKMADEYIEEDHVDGKGNEENNIEL